jgi:hypothetical protein
MILILATFITWQSTHSVFAQVTTTPQEKAEPVDPTREKQKEAYFEKLKEGESNSIKKAEVPSEFSAEPLPNWNDTGDFEADKAAYQLAVEGWLERNAHLYSEEEISFLRNPILKVEDRERNLKSN